MPKKQTTLFILLLAVFTMAVSGCSEQPENNRVNNSDQQKEEQEGALNKIKERMFNLNISDWEVFKNEKIGYLIAYPLKKWECGGGSCTNIENKSWGATIPNIKISLLRNTDIVDPVKYVEKSYDPSFFLTPIPSKINYENYGRKGVKLTHIEGNKSFGENKVVYIFLRVDENLVKIEAHIDEKNKEEAVMEKMLQSIVFFNKNTGRVEQSKKNQTQTDKNIQLNQERVGLNEIEKKMADIDVSDWEVFKSNEAGYFMAYPADTWKCGYQKIDKPYVCSSIEGKIGNDMIYNIRIDVVDDTDISDPVAYVNKNYNDSFFVTTIPDEINYEISGNKALKLTHILSDKGTKKGKVIFVFVEHNGKMVEIAGRVDKEDREKETIEKMLQTIVFFNKSKEDNIKEEVSTEIKYLDNGEIDTSDWKTYRNEVYGLTMKYPPFLNASKKDAKHFRFGIEGDWNYHYYFHKFNIFDCLDLNTMEERKQYFTEKYSEKPGYEQLDIRNGYAFFYYGHTKSGYRPTVNIIGKEYSLSALKEIYSQTPNFDKEDQKYIDIFKASIETIKFDLAKLQSLPQ